MSTTQQPESLRLAGLLELAPEDGVEPQTTEDAAAELRRQHARIAELESIGAGAGSEPIAWLVCTEEGDPDMVFLSQHESRQYLEDDEHPTPLYTHPSPPEGMAGGWMPIETAPKDGTRILLHPAVEVHDAWSKGHWSEQQKCWIVGGSASGVTHTHWMPLPLPPTTSAGAERGSES